jgi:hypothetical protein
MFPLQHFMAFFGSFYSFVLVDAKNFSFVLSFSFPEGSPRTPELASLEPPSYDCKRFQPSDPGAGRKRTLKRRKANACSASTYTSFGLVVYHHLPRLGTVPEMAKVTFNHVYL